VTGEVVLIVGDDDDAHAAAVARRVAAGGAVAAYLDFRRFPGAAALTWDPIRRRGELALADGAIDLQRVRSVYWRTAGSTRAAAGLRGDLHRFAEEETRKALESLLRGLGCPVINPPEAIAAHRCKPVQSAAVAALGVAVPDTVITSDPAAAAAMFAAHPDGVVVKPVGGGAYARRLTRGDLARGASIRASPMQYQAWIAGEDLRVYVLGEVVLAGRIVVRDPTRVDFRTDPDHHSESVTLSPEQATQCRLIARTLGLVWTGIDLRRTPAGELVFLEANPSPMFLRFERDTGHPILATLVDLLLGVAAANPVD
jgi:hypothetical protein